MGRRTKNRDQNFDPLTKKLPTMMRRKSPQRSKMIAAKFFRSSLEDKFEDSSEGRKARSEAFSFMCLGAQGLCTEHAPLFANVLLSNDFLPCNEDNASEVRGVQAKYLQAYDQERQYSHLHNVNREIDQKFMAIKEKIWTAQGGQWNMRAKYQLLAYLVSPAWIQYICDQIKSLGPNWCGGCNTKLVWGPHYILAPFMGRPF